MASPFSNSKKVVGDVDELLISKRNLVTIELIRKTRHEICLLEQERLLSRESRYSESQMDLINRSNERKVSLILMNDRFIRSTLASKYFGTSLWFPIPSRWQHVFKENSFSINRSVSTVMYFAVVVYLEVKNIVRIVASILSEARFVSSEWFSDFTWLTRSGAVLARRDNPLLTAKGVEIENFATWIKKEFRFEVESESSLKKNSEMRFRMSQRLRTVLKVVINKKVFFPGIWKYIKYIGISELILNEITETQAKKSNVQILLFDNSQRNSKPIWAKTLERSGVRVCLVFYSTEDEPLFENGDTPRIDFWNFSKWNEVWYINDRQRDRIRKSLGYEPSRFTRVGFLWWADNGFKLPSKTRGVLSLFSLEPLKNDLTLNPGLYYGLGKISVSLEVIEILLQICKESNLEFWHKPKRDIPKTRVPEYAQFLRKLAETEGRYYKEIHPEISSSRLIKSSNQVVSVPCTSTALEAKSLGIPSAFFVPIHDFEIAKNLCSEVPLFRSDQEIRLWVAANLRPES
jgi:hypothetical protein